MSKKYSENRREFLRSLGRGATLGLLVLGGGSLMKKGDKPIETCVSDGICSNCSDLKACGLPQALSYRQSDS
ncbi:MAG: hypothetical protein NT018_09720 [Armatimonadetes bacterium]|nr:hypothetical protein [Armatimonadota bacterium]